MLSLKSLSPVGLILRTIKDKRVQRAGQDHRLRLPRLEHNEEPGQRTLLLNEGRIVSLGDTEKVINDYLGILQAK